MYEMNVRVREYVGTIGVSAVLHERDEHGNVQAVADAPERFFEASPAARDAFQECLEALVRWARIPE